ncbi:alanyl-tRNA synthetase [Selenomonas ruminantium]|uniref:Alanine--tRNA ligase n=2 Tax=Selenomonas ruminantium TaxID=971 RepID=A0A1I0V038_SELRU|nr:alanine--tRNA ligase [Selenomonas ruminantium]SFA68906.1 alanyl-tRNA synthetase [Selenomonas ruminantium]
MSGNELREAYLQFFAEKKGHLRLPSFSLIPQDDPTLLLIGAGMAPLKPFFTGKMKPPRTRVTTSQRCVRTGDIENVGRTARHQTFFEMLGNFSFGDYFKGEAIPWAWEFLTEVVELPKDKLWVTVYPDDDEAIEIWKSQPGFPQDHIVKMEDNFWEIGPGPCGPDSEIYIDLGEERGCGSPDCAVGCDCDRYLEIWNLVFTQYDKQEDGSYKNLAHKNIDTGCGLERLASVVQEKKTNFETDLLYPIIEYAAGVAGVTYGEDAEKDISLKVIADHARSMAIMIMDGILPSNEGRGYVLRRILRRAIRHGRMLGIKDKFLEGAVNAAVEIYRGAKDFEELINKADYIKKVISLEEDRFAATLNQGMELLGAEIEKVKAAGKMALDGEVTFRLYDTFGFPWELTEEILHENGLELDKEGFDKAMDEQRTRARNARAENTRVAVPDLSSIDVSKLTVDEKATAGKVVAIWQDGKLVDEITDGQEAGVILTTTPFYAEGGGQVGDEGILTSELGHISVSNAKKLPDGTVYHVAYVEEGQLKVGDEVKIAVNKAQKLASARNHTATHLLQAALKKVVGDQISQAGSSVTPERLRFDFTNFEPVTAQQLADVEELVNNEILKGQDVEISHMSLEEAKEAGAMALFSEKYGDVVRVVKVPDFSMELCGGSHVANVGQIGMFKIVSESGVASGVRRIEAITGKAALDYANAKMAVLAEAAGKLKTKEEEVPAQIEKLQGEMKAMQKQLDEVAAMRDKADAAKLIAGLQDINGVNVVCGKTNAGSMDELREVADMTSSKLDTPSVVVLACANDGKVNLVVKATKEANAKGIHAGKIIKEAAAVVGGGGGGRPDMAQAGGKNAEALPQAFDKAVEVIKAQLG